MISTNRKLDLFYSSLKLKIQVKASLKVIMTKTHNNFEAKSTSKLAHFFKFVLVNLFVVKYFRNSILIPLKMPFSVAYIRVLAFDQKNNH